MACDVSPVAMFWDWKVKCADFFFFRMYVGETFEKKQNMNNLLDKIVRISSEMALQVHILAFKAMQYCASEFAIMSKIYKQHQVCKI